MPEGEILVKKFLYDPAGRPSGNITGILQTDSKLRHWSWDLSKLPGSLSSLTNVELFFHLLEMYRESNAPGTEIVVFKAWELLHSLGRIPENLIEKYRVRYFGLVRDIRAVVASQRTTIYKNRPLENNTLGTVFKWKAFLKVCQARKKYIEILEYENMIRNHRLFFTALLREMDLTWDRSMEVSSGSVGNLLTEDQKLLHPNIDKPPETDFIDQWKSKLPPEEIVLIQSYARKELTELGYGISEVRAPGLLLLYIKLKYLAGYCMVRIFYPSG